MPPACTILPARVPTNTAPVIKLLPPNNNASEPIAIDSTTLAPAPYPLKAAFPIAILFAFESA